MRPSFESIYAGFARDLSRRSTCTRAAVGCVITSLDYRQVYAVGYNGGASGEADSCTGEQGKCGCLHAEDNATINCTVARDIEKMVFVTTQPCYDCAARLINLGGVRAVMYLDAYRCQRGIKRLRQAGIQVIHLTESQVPSE